MWWNYKKCHLSKNRYITSRSLLAPPCNQCDSKQYYVLLILRFLYYSIAIIENISEACEGKANPPATKTSNLNSLMSFVDNRYPYGSVTVAVIADVRECLERPTLPLRGRSSILVPSRQPFEIHSSGVRSLHSWELNSCRKGIFLSWPHYHSPPKSSRFKAY